MTQLRHCSMLCQSAKRRLSQSAACAKWSSYSLPDQLRQGRCAAQISSVQITCWTLLWWQSRWCILFSQVVKLWKHRIYPPRDKSTQDRHRREQPLWRIDSKCKAMMHLMEATSDCKACAIEGKSKLLKILGWQTVCVLSAASYEISKRIGAGNYKHVKLE